MIERTGYSFEIEITYERLSAFCTHCKNIGHHITSCRWLHPAKDNHVIDKQKRKKKYSFTETAGSEMAS